MLRETRHKSVMKGFTTALLSLSLSLSLSLAKVVGVVTFYVKQYRVVSSFDAREISPTSHTYTIACMYAHTHARARTYARALQCVQV